MRGRSSIFAFTLVGMAAMAPAADQSITYPQTKRVDCVDDYHGTKVGDPYRWLEDDVRKSPEVAAWVAAENQVTNAYLAKIPERENAAIVGEHVDPMSERFHIEAPARGALHPAVAGGFEHFGDAGIGEGGGKTTHLTW